MRDALEEQLAARLRELGDLTPETLEPPADLEVRVARRKKAARGRRAGTALAVAACLLAIVVAATVLDGRTGNAPVAVAPAHDPLPAGTVMLGAKGRYVTARDAAGNVLATMVTTTKGDVLDAQVTADHKTIFYRVTDPTSPCDKIARADIDGRTSSFVARGDLFAISPDGASLAVAGYGDISSRHCAATGKAEFAMLDLGRGTAVRRDTGPVYSELVWNPDGLLLGRACESIAVCSDLVAWRDVGGAGQVLIDGKTRLVERGHDGVYRVDSPAARVAGGWIVSVTRDAVTSTPTELGEVPASWNVFDIVPTNSGVLLVASSPADHIVRLYRLVDGRLELVSDADPGAASPVFPLSQPAP